MITVCINIGVDCDKHLEWDCIMSASVLYSIPLRNRVRQAIKHFKEVGWVQDGKEWICPKCRVRIDKSKEEK
jgi:hypothetical protein